MNFRDLDVVIANSRRRSIASSLIACLLDAADSGVDGIDLDDFEKETCLIRNNITSVAGYLQKQGVINILYYRDNTEHRNYVLVNTFGRWAKQHYELTSAIKNLFNRS
ncbi:MAG: hypothetical protein XXXJIFNMEKO3_LKCDNKCA_00097 (plasmid) [Candidatus Erwinia impunctatus]